MQSKFSNSSTRLSRTRSIRKRDERSEKKHQIVTREGSLVEQERKYWCDKNVNIKVKQQIKMQHLKVRPQ